MVRMTGRTPILVPEHLKNEPVMHAFDPELGWTNKSGAYTVPPYSPQGSTINVTMNQNGSRKTSLENIVGDSRSAVIFVGGSYTQGWAVSDEDTFSWKLQERFPELDIANYGTGGYGTYQSFLTAKRVLKQYPEGSHFIYCLVYFHDSRNVATVSHLRALASSARRGHVLLPYVSTDENGELIYHQPEKYLTLPLRNSSALVAFVERVFMKIKTLGREEIKQKAIEKLLLEINEYLKSHKMRFSVVILRADSPQVSHYLEFFNQSKIDAKDCSIDLAPELRVEGEGHPNPIAHQQWADCIAPLVSVSETAN